MSAAAESIPARTPWLRIVAVVLASRLLLFFVGLFTLHSHARPADWNWATILDLSCRWDCGWYLVISGAGYHAPEAALAGTPNWAFYPLLPMLMRGAQALGIADPRVAALLISSIAFVLALGWIHRYARLLGNSERVAATTVMIIAFLPHGIVFSSAYTESLFLCLLAGTMLALRERRYLLAGIAAALLSATRSNGIFVIVFIVVQLYLQLGPQAFFRPWRVPQAFVPLLMAPLGAFAFWAFAFVATGDAFAMTTTVRHGWAWSWEPPLSNLVMFLEIDPDARFWLLGSLFAAACATLMLRYRWYAEFAFCAVVFVLIWGGSVPNSLWRYSMVLFPAWIALARLLDTRESLRLGLFAALGIIGGYVMHAWALQLRVAI
jgi:hypothetical protein